MAWRFEDVEANLVRTKGLFWRPNLRMRECSWVSLERESQVWMRDMQFCSATLLVVEVDGGWSEIVGRDVFTVRRSLDLENENCIYEMWRERETEVH